MPRLKHAKHLLCPIAIQFPIPRWATAERIQLVLDLSSFARIGLLFEDEAHRVGVPRLTEGGEIVVALQIQPLRTRKETQDFLVAEGARLFEERGWHDGLKLWKEKTRPFY